MKIDLIITFFRNLYFIYNLFLIFSTEFFLYFLFNNYAQFIENIFYRLASVNILYVKLFQAIAHNNCFIDDFINNKLLLFTDKAPWDICDINYIDLISVVNDYNLVLLDEIERPMNSGMISLVYRAQDIKTREKLIIKLKRNNIEDKLKFAISDIQFLIKLLSFIPYIQYMQLEELINKNIEMIYNQTNFLQETENIIKMGNNCTNLKYIKIPQVRKNITMDYPNIIVMEFMEGNKLNDIQIEDYENFAVPIIKYGIVSTIIHGFTHGDLHSGNILFIKEENDLKYPYKIGLIDFGLVYEIEDRYKSIFFDIISDMFNKDTELTADKLLNCGILEPQIIKNSLPYYHYKNILEFTKKIIDETLFEYKTANQIQIYKFLFKLKDYIQSKEITNLGIKLSALFMNLLLVLTMSHGVTLTLCKDKFISLSDKIINDLFHTNLMKDE